ncbi:alpha/beta fold hydrolase [Haloferax sp. YSMS24]|uniref:alpha/beta fold hydrolase n=1 Tax=Haloferax sp. YSMS24 TaxID=3388425 RepID=UPI00398D00B2
MPTVQTNEIETYYVQRGEGPPLVFVHAALVDHSMWAPQLDALADEYTVYAYDLRGHGRTGGSAVESYSVDLFADDLDAFLTALEVERPVLCGHSLGGAVTQVYAARYPDSISGLVLADSWTSELTDWRDRLTLLLLNTQIRLVRVVGLERAQRAGTWLQERFNPDAGGEYGTWEQLQAEMPPIPFEEFEKIVRAITTFTNVTVDLRSISVPTLVMYGENTVGYGRRQATRLAAEIPDATLEVVPGGGHGSNLDNPSFYSGAVASFIEERVTSGVAGSVA